MAFLDENGLALLVRKIKDTLLLNPVLVVHVATGSLVTATYGGFEVQGGSVGGKAELTLPTTGQWSVVATKDNRTSTPVVVNVEENIRYHINVFFDGVWGVVWSKSADPTWARTDDAEFFSDPVPYTAGSLIYGSPFDELYPWCEMKIVHHSVVGDTVSIPKFWYKWTETSSTLKLQISNHAEDGFSVSPSHIARYSGDTEKDMIYIGRYHCNNHFTSVTGEEPVTGLTRQAARTNIHSKGEKIFSYDYAAYWTIRMLYLVEYANWNSQLCIGYGCGDNISRTSVGYTDSMPYHTGTTQALRTDFGYGTQYRYIEGLWDNCFDWCDGIYFANEKVYIIDDPRSFSDSTGGVYICDRPTEDGFPSSYTIPSVEGYSWALFPKTLSPTSPTTYTTDMYYYTSNGAVLYTGGRYEQTNLRGLFYMNVQQPASAGIQTAGCRLQVLG